MENGCLAPRRRRTWSRARTGAARRRRCGRRCRGTRSATARPPRPLTRQRPHRSCAAAADGRRRARDARRAQRARHAPRCPRTRRAAGRGGRRRHARGPRDRARLQRPAAHAREHGDARREPQRDARALARLQGASDTPGASRGGGSRRAAFGAAGPARAWRSRARARSLSSTASSAATPEPAHDDDDELAAFARFEAPRAAALDAEEGAEESGPSRLISTRELRIARGGFPRGDRRRKRR